MLLNRYSGRSYNDLAQYPIMPWVIANYTGENNCRDIDREFWKQSLNFRNLELPPGKLDSTKFAKLKSRLQELEDCD